jgi:hypothetical protein
MNIKTGFGILFGLPTILLVFIYGYFGVNNYWQLFLFSTMILIAYIPGMLLMHFVYTCRMRNKVHGELGSLGIIEE